MNAFRCELCYLEIDPHDRFTWQRVVGWEQRRTQGGTNHIALREPRQEFAHPLCIRMARQGHLAQEQLS